MAGGRYAIPLLQTELSTLLVPRYAAKDRDGFDYSVKWLKIFGGYEYGVILKDPNDPSNGYMFYIIPDGQVIDAEYQDKMVKACAVVVIPRNPVN